MPSSVRSYRSRQSRGAPRGGRLHFGGAAVPQIASSGLIADYRFNEGSGTTVTDYSGSGNGGTFSTGLEPTWVSNGLSFPSIGKQVAIPVPVANVQTVQALITLGIGVPQYVPIIGNSVNDSSHLNWYLFATTQPYYNPIFFNGSIAGGTNVIVPGSTCVVTWITNGSSDVCGHNDNLCVPMGTNLAAVGRTGSLYLGMTPGYSGASTVGFLGTMHRVLVYSRPITTTATTGEFYTNHAAWQAYATSRGLSLPGYTSAATNTLFALGDSISYGSGATSFSTAWFQSMSLTRAYSRANIATVGNTTTNLLQYTFKEAKYAYSSGGRNVVTVMIGTNDCALTKTPAETFANYYSIISQLATLGYKVIAIPMISRTPSGSTVSAGYATPDAWKNAYNPMIADPTSVGYAAWSANVSVISTSSLSPLCNDGAYSGSNFADAVHPNQAGHDIIKVAVAAAINALG